MSRIAVNGLIANGSDLAVVEESNRDLTHAFKLYVIQR